MESVVAKARKWGNSVGVILPKEVVEKAGIKPGSDVELLVSAKQKNVLKELFGALKGKEKIKISTEELMREIDRELYND